MVSRVKAGHAKTLAVVPRRSVVACLPSYAPSKGAVAAAVSGPNTALHLTASSPVRPSLRLPAAGEFGRSVTQQT